MAGFAEMAANFRRGPQEQQMDGLRSVVNGSARPYLEQADRVRARVTGEGCFKQLGLQAFLLEAENFAKFEDKPPHPDAHLVFDYYEPETPAEEEMGGTPTAIAELRMDVVGGDAAAGYRYARIEERLLGAQATVTGAEQEDFWLGTEEVLEEIKRAFVKAYHNPGIKHAMDIAPDDLKKTQIGTTNINEPPPAPPKTIHFLNETGDYGPDA